MQKHGAKTKELVDDCGLLGSGFQVTRLTFVRRRTSHRLIMRSQLAAAEDKTKGTSLSMVLQVRHQEAEHLSGYIGPSVVGGTRTRGYDAGVDNISTGMPEVGDVRADKLVPLRGLVAG